MKKFTLIVWSCLLFSHVISQDSRYVGKTIFPFGVVEEINSEELNEKRILNIYLPDGYHPDSAYTYPVVYVLDGSYNEDFPHIAGLVQFMNMYDIMPKSIVVGIANINRYRDFTYPSLVKEDIEINPANGGSEKFMNFIEKEVQPFVEKNYKTNEHSTIIGQSLGGLLATEILVKKPHLFEDYIIVSPSLWWDNEVLVNNIDEYFLSNQNLKKRIYISIGKEHPVMHKVADKLAEAIKNSKNENLEWYYQPILSEDHGTILHKAVYAAFEKLYEKTED